MLKLSPANEVHLIFIHRAKTDDPVSFHSSEITLVRLLRMNYECFVLTQRYVMENAANAMKFAMELIANYTWRNGSAQAAHSTWPLRYDRLPEKVPACATAAQKFANRQPQGFDTIKDNETDWLIRDNRTTNRFQAVCTIYCTTHISSLIA